MTKKQLTILYALNNIPIEILDDPLERYFPPSKVNAMKSILNNMPETGVLLVSGTANPIINYIFLQRRIYGIDFVQYYEEQFVDKKIDIPKKMGVYYIYNIGKEPAKNKEYSAKLLESFIASHRNAFIILETTLPKTEFERTYRLSFVNYLTIKALQKIERF